LKSHPDIKFSTKAFHKAVEETPDLWNWLLDDCRPYLEGLLSSSPINPQKDMAMDKLDDLLTESFSVTDSGKDDLVA
jgi:hypothetical protein